MHTLKHHSDWCWGKYKWQYPIHMYSGITSGRALDGELLHTKILEVNFFAFAYRLFHEDFSSIRRTSVGECI